MIRYTKWIICFFIFFAIGGFYLFNKYKSDRNIAKINNAELVVETPEDVEIDASERIKILIQEAFEAGIDELEDTTQDMGQSNPKTNYANEYNHVPVDAKPSAKLDRSQRADSLDQSVDPEYTTMSKLEEQREVRQVPYKRYSLFEGVTVVDSDEDGVSVFGIKLGCPMQKAGIRKGDVIIMIDDFKIGSIHTFPKLSRKIGHNKTKASILFIRNNRKIKKTVKSDRTYTILSE
jgi:C-terminal processing protease CtpA/Prc